MRTKAKTNLIIAIKGRALKNKVTFEKQSLLDIHCLAENIIDEIEKTPTHNKIEPTKVSQDFILEKAGEILDLALL